MKNADYTVIHQRVYHLQYIGLYHRLYLFSILGLSSKELRERLGSKPWSTLKKVSALWRPRRSKVKKVLAPLSIECRVRLERGRDDGVDPYSFILSLWTVEQ